ncbi:Bug family tripartite tricarboxylate transporter substrate binding protein [Variovorax ginsengisoli]|uniref:Tripartite tricarboxylate transporter substrate binding protein n=1 Tax=Variovorax ginsengisoli TaxID=363844 RepID=A0ABT8SCR2_9BURK|nr:tripartite tricarboxylate transporter substrate binding protein [Variovorax ginsengisoli]MDN8617516.1 tripartite tricarboxylate transporter substrate binding protein [Variovorax ginsengisoli]MDO1536686.1 tripartite tricarboxylate transporter substrate binding protein [Variovorax ginsengisoli]
MSRQYPHSIGYDPNRRQALEASLLTVASLATPRVFAQSYPSKPITIVVPSPPGGILDSTARFSGDILARRLGQAVVIDNKGGGSGNIAYGQVAHAAPDGYTLLASNSGFHLINPTLTPRLPWAQKDLVPISMIGTSPNLILVNAEVPVKSLKELIAYLKANPGKLAYASQGNGTISHIGTERFKQETGTDMLHVPYRGTSPAMIDVLSNQVQVIFATPAAVQGYIKQGRLRALAVASKTRYAPLPDVPTAAEAGVPDFELDTWVALCAPTGTPPEVIVRLSQQLQQAFANEETRRTAEDAGFELHYESPQALAQRIRRETKYWAAVIAKAGIRAD